MKRYNRLLSLSLLGISPFLFQGTALAESTKFDPVQFTPAKPLISQYIKTPSYITSGAKPLVMLLLDTSGSMEFDAYTDNCDSSETTGGYGYFDPDLNYTYNSRQDLYTPETRGRLSGRSLNCKYMQRIDIARKVLTGGKAIDTTEENGTILTSTLQTNSGHKVIVSGDVSGVIQSSSDDVRFGLTTFDTSGNAQGGKVRQSIGSSTSSIVDTINAVNPSGGTPLAESLWTIIGYFQQNNSNAHATSTTAYGTFKRTYWDGRKYRSYTVDEDLGPNYTYRAGRTYSSYTDKAYEVDTTWDPFYNDDEKTTIDCAPAYVITMTDGLPSVDFCVPDNVIESNEGEQISMMDDDGGDPIKIYYDDVSWYAHNTDLRPDIDGEQNLDIYNIFTFGEDRGMELMNTSSANGGTENAYQANSGEAISEAMAAILGDIAANSTTESSVSVIQGSRDGTGATYQASYFPEKESVDGTESVTWVGDVQALFIDSQSNFRENTVDTPNTNQLDPTEDLIYTTESTGSTVVAKLYHDYNGDGVLDEALSEADEGEDFDGDGYMTSTIDETEFITKSIEDVKYLWSAADWLNSSTLDPTSQRSYSGTDSKRFITTWIDSDNDGVIDEDERKDFTTAALGSETFYGYFLGNNNINTYVNTNEKTTPIDLDNLINYIRGQDFDEMRSRTIDGTTYRLGDIIDSTPTAVQTPSDNYDTRFNSTTYREFKQAYADRRTMVYAGGNDGLFHAFNGGFFQSSYTPDGKTTPITNKFWLHRNTSGDTVTYDDSTGLPLGAEMWAYAPYNLLPHLQWLTGDDYQHIYYNNLKSKVFAARLWEEKDSDTVHVGGWGTLLIGGMKWGGGPITTDVNAGTSEDADNRTMRSAYFVFDVTDPEMEPVLLSEFTLDDDTRFSFANVYPSVVPVKGDATKTDPDTWFLALGNGPSGLKGESDQEGALIIRQFNTKLDMGQGLKKIGDLWKTIGGTTSPKEVSFLTGEDNSFISNPYTPDLQQGTADGAFTADSIYFGTVAGSFPSDDENDPGEWTGKMHRVAIQKTTDSSASSDWADPTTWTEGVFFDAKAPVSTSPIVSEDDQGNYWVFFGTGRFYDQQDKKSTADQAFYGLKEPSDITDSDSDKLPNYSTVSNETADILDVSDATVYVGDSAKESAVTGLTSIENFSDLENAMDLTYDGWKVVFDADSGERNNTDSLLVSGIIVFNSYSPAYNICDTGGTSHVYTRYYKTGTAYWAGSVGVDEDTTTTYLGVTLYKALDTFEVSGFLPKLTYVAGDASQSEDERSTTGALIGISNTPELINLDLTPALDNASGKISWEQVNDD
jgi:type IV pilus assembly protein PilY1